MRVVQAAVGCADLTHSPRRQKTFLVPLQRVPCRLLAIFPPRCVVGDACSQAERINLLKQAVEKYGNGKKDDDLTPCVVLGDDANAAAGSS